MITSKKKVCVKVLREQPITDSIFIEEDLYFLELEKTWRQNNRIPTELQLVEIFSDVAIEAITNCLKNLTKERRLVVSIIEEKLALVYRNTTDEFSRYFYKTCLLHFWEGKELGEIDSHIQRLRRMQELIRSPHARENHRNFEHLKLRALDRPILEVAQSFVERLRPNGKNRHKALCPLHEEKTPSFVIFEDRNTFYCFGCNRGGDSIAFVRLLKNCSFKQAIYFLTA